MRDWLVVAGVALLHLLTFLNKPAHIDDTLYLATVRGILADPLRPLANVYNWEQYPRPIYTFAVNPPLYSYQQTLLVRIFGWNLPVLHVLGALYVALACAGMLALARRFTQRPVAATLLLLLSPVVLPATNLMLDVPCLALLIAAFACWVRGVDRDSRRALAASALLATAAVLTKYNSLLVLPALPLYAALNGRRRAARWMLVPLAGLALWMLHNHFFLPGGAIHLFQSRGRAQFGGAGGALRVLLLTISWGSAFFFLPALAVARWPRGAAMWGALALAVVVVAADVYFLIKPLSPWGFAHYGEHAFFLVNGALLGAFVLAGLGSSLQRSAWGEQTARDDLFLLLWPLGIVVFNLLAAPHQAPRYYFPAYAAMPLLLMRALDRARPGRDAWIRGAIWASVALEAAVGLTLAVSDQAFATASRDFAQRLGRLADEQNQMITYVGHWGFQYYADQEPRLRCIDVRAPEPPPGTVLALPTDVFRPELPPWLDGLHPAAQRGLMESTYRAADSTVAHVRFIVIQPPWTAPRPAPLVTMSLLDRACLYASGGSDASILPYTLAGPTFHALFVIERVP